MDGSTTIDEIIQVFVRTIRGPILVLDLKSTDLVTTLKKKIYDKEGISIKMQCLFANTKELTDDKTLEECGVGNLDTIHIYMNMS